jgi:hypothetical protein
VSEGDQIVDLGLETEIAILLSGSGVVARRGGGNRIKA